MKWFGGRWFALGVLSLGLLLAYLTQSVGLAIGTIAAAAGLLALSFWPGKWVTEFRELGVVLESDLAEIDRRAGLRLVDYEWIENIRWDEEGRLVMAIHEDASLFIPAGFTRTPVPADARPEVTRILRARMGKSRAELEAMPAHPREQKPE
jgi:hypothetical protein